MSASRRLGLIALLCRPSIARSVIGAVVALALVTLLATGLLLAQLNRLKVNGPLYADIKQAGDLTADILPPPLYVIEAYLTLHQMVVAADPAPLRVRWQALKAEFDQREAYWAKAPLPEDVQRLLVREVVPSGRAFFEQAERQVLPALAGVPGAGLAALGELAVAYDRHRAAVDQLVERANGAVSGAEAAAVTGETRLGWIVPGIFLIVALVVGGSALFMVWRVSRPIAALTSGMYRLADGEVDVPIPGIGRRDELGQAATALTVFRDQLLNTRRLEAAQVEARLTAETDRRDAVRGMADEIEAKAAEAIERVNAMTAEMARAARLMADASGRSERNAGEASDAAELALSTAETVASAAEELTASIAEITRQVASAAAATRQPVAAGAETRTRIDTCLLYTSPSPRD
jgi:HAMP domain-containing protein